MKRADRAIAMRTPPSRALLEMLEPRALLSAGDVLTYHDDIARTGANLHETILTPQNVNAATFGKRFDLPVDGKVDAQPLYVSHLKISASGRHDVIFAATEHDSVYAFDARTGQQLWQVSVLPAGEAPSDPHLPCGQIYPEIGITSTPVIDRSRGPHGAIYVVAMSKDAAGAYHQRLHALDLATGAEMLGGPREITASYPGSGENSVNGNVVFDPGQYAERCALLLSKGVIYTSWTSHCDTPPYNAWVMGFSAKNLMPVSVLNLTPNGSEGAFWASGGGPAADAQGNIYLTSGNGTFDATLNASGFPQNGDYGDTVLKLSPKRSLHVADYFTPYNQAYYNATDYDLGSTTPMLLPPMRDASGRTRQLAITSGKDGHLYLAERGNLGKYNAATQDNRNVYQEVSSVLYGGVFSTMAYYNNAVYVGPVGDFIRAFGIDQARLTPQSIARSPETFQYPGASPSVSANGKKDAIVWAVENGNEAALHAFDAAALSHELYDSRQNDARDSLGVGNKFITPVIAGGEVFVGTTNSVAVYGLLS